ncbi:MAG TPA: phosphoenolpyruvate carboxykinase [archaeon]|nr:phosphoenolpyruvate carboxykinase [archaeon]
MRAKSLLCYGKQFIIHTEGTVCSSPVELLASNILEELLWDYLGALREHDNVTFYSLFGRVSQEKAFSRILKLLRMLIAHPLHQLVGVLPSARHFEDKHAELEEFIQEFYNHWRIRERFLLCLGEQGPWSYDTRPYRTFNATVEQLTHVMRATYRDILENITRDHPRVYRQVQAGCQAGVIAVPKNWPAPEGVYKSLAQIPFVRQVWIDPPMVIDPPTNRRDGRFSRTDRNPLEGMPLDPAEWLCYPALVGSVLVFVYFHLRFIGLGISLSNLFELARDEDIARGPDAVYFFGADRFHMATYGELPTVFHEDKKAGLLVAAVPDEDRFGYFGYLKKMVLTLHNIVIMERGRMPFHGAMCRILLRGGQYANVLLIGDTATGKSETLEALRRTGGRKVQSLKIVADDMGSLEIDEREGGLRGYGTEIGAFIRLDDLQAGYAFGQIDRAIIMSPHRINARVVLPVTSLREVNHGYPLDYLLYANNYEQIGQARPVLEAFSDKAQALETFRKGAAMAKGTTTSTGLVENYFANIFGPPQYKELHERLAGKTFGAAFKAGVWVGQMRTRLGIPGWETKGPEAAAQELLNLISRRKRKVPEKSPGP